jgi:hypothetical protein
VGQHGQEFILAMVVLLQCFFGLLLVGNIEYMRYESSDLAFSIEIWRIGGSVALVGNGHFR